MRLACVCAALLSACVWPSEDPSPPATPGAEPPNLVLIIGDDLGYPYHGFLGDPIARTPNLDRLAREGTVFTTGYVTASVCSPSLHTLLTGREPVGRTDGSPDRAPRDLGNASLPARLSKRGYASFQAGKFWFAGARLSGFTEGTKNEHSAGDANTRWMGGAEGLEIGRTTMEPVFDFLSRHRDRPFLLWFAPKLPHRPWNAPSVLRRPYREAHPQLSPATIGYYANISWFDDAVGALLSRLDREGLRERTLIVYLSDNGYGPSPEEGLPVAAWQGAKGTTSELGFRTPIVFNWPGHVPAGVVRDDLVSSLDVVPTLLDFAGLPHPADLPGLDLRPAIDGAPVGRAEIIGRMRNVRLVEPTWKTPSKKTSAYFLRDDRWHYVWSPASGTEMLFDVVADPQERANRAAEYPDVVRELRARVERWRDES